MHGRITLLFAGIALALGGGVAGAALVGGGSSAPEAQVGSLTAERGAAEAQKIATAKLHHALSVAQRARRLARIARSKANRGLATAVALLDEVDKALAESATALAAAQAAGADATSALQKANGVSSQLDSTRVATGTAAGLVQTAEENDYEDLGGPRVTTTVPSSGLVEIWVTVTFGDDGNGAVAADGAVALFQDGQLVTQVDEENLCQSFSGSSLENMLLSSSGPAGAEIALSTPGAAELFFGGCGAIGSTPSPILIQAPPGEHTYELRYGDCGCEIEPAGFKERTLRVAPRL